MLKNQKIIYTSGTFDLFHSNHLKMIKYARGLGELLIGGVPARLLKIRGENVQ